MTAPTTTDQPAKPLRVFVVDDHRDTREMVQMYLEACGYVVSSASTITAALEALPQADCDVLISDIGLPDGDGWLLLHRLQLPRPIYAVAMSGYGSPEDHLKSKNAGFRHHLLKPVRPEQLDVALDQATRELAAVR